MVNIRKRTNSNFRGGGNIYRTPSYFAGGKTEKKKFKLRFVHIKYSFLAILFLYGLSFLFFSGQFNVREIIVEGNSLITTDEIKAKFPTDQNVLLINSQELEQKYLLDFREINNIQIFRGLPNAVKIVINEREPKLIWESGGKKYLVSSEGEVMREIGEEAQYNLAKVVDKRSLPVQAGEKIVSDEFIAFTSNMYANFYPGVNIKPTYFEIDETTFDINLYTEAGFYVKLNTLRASKKQIDNLKIVLMEKRQEVKEYVDLRIDGWAYYK